MFNRRKLYHSASRFWASGLRVALREWSYYHRDCSRAESCEKFLRIPLEARSQVHPSWKVLLSALPTATGVKAFSRQRRSALQPSQIQLIYHRFVWTVFSHFCTSFLRRRCHKLTTCVGDRFFQRLRANSMSVWLNSSLGFRNASARNGGENVVCIVALVLFPLLEVRDRGKKARWNITDSLALVAIATLMLQSGLGHLHERKSKVAYHQVSLN